MGKKVALDSEKGLNVIVGVACRKVLKEHSKEQLSAIIDGERKYGATTLVVGLIDKKGILRTVSIGDSGIRIFDAQGKFVGGTEDGEGGFNAPYQLVGAKEAIELITEDQVKYKEFSLKPGQTIITMSDGVSDVLSDNEIGGLLQKNSGAEGIINAVKGYQGKTKEGNPWYKKAREYVLENKHKYILDWEKLKNGLSGLSLYKKIRGVNIVLIEFLGYFF